MNVMMGARGLSSSSFAGSGGGGATTTFSSLWTPPPFSRRSFSRTNPCRSAIFVATSGSIVWLAFTKMLKSTISSLISWKFFTPSCVASSLTMIGGLIVMTFFGSSSTGGATSAACPSVDETGATSATGAGGGGGGSTTGGGGAVSPGFATSFEIGGKNVFLTFGTPSADFAFGLSINETDSILLADLGFSSVFSGAAAVIRAGAALSFAGAAARAGFSAAFALDSLTLGGVSF